MDTAIATAVGIIRRGGVMAYPTEAVYGLGCDPAQESALRRLLELKQRDPGKGIILIASDYHQLIPYIAPVSPEHERKMFAEWPGPVTWIVPAGPSLSPLVTGGRPSVAVRVTAHDIAARLCREFGGAITSTSANVSGESPARLASDVRRIWGDELEYVLDAPVGGAVRPTQIRDLLTGAILRS